jgi:hypothetical protein
MIWKYIQKKPLLGNKVPSDFLKLSEVTADRRQLRAVCSSNDPSATKESPTSSRQDIRAELRRGPEPSEVQKLTRNFQTSY